MSSESLPDERLDSRFSTPAPELDDHRNGLGVHPAHATLNVPALEVQVPTPRPSEIGERDPMSADGALLNSRDQESNPIARDFETAIDDEYKSDAENDVSPNMGRRASFRIRRLTNNREAREAREARTPRINPRHAVAKV